MDHPPWLPLNWTAETKVVKKGPSSGTTYRCYTELSTGKKFYSRPKVLSYLNLNMQKNGENSNQQASPVTKEQQPELPPALTQAEWNFIGEIYNSTVSGGERFPLASIQQNTNNPTPQVSETTAMEEDQVEVGHDQVIVISTSEADDLMEEMLTTGSNNQSDHGTQNNNEGETEQKAAAEEEEEDAEKLVPNSNKSLSPSSRCSSKRLAGTVEPELHSLLVDHMPLMKTGKRSARLRRKLTPESIEVPEMDIDNKVEEQQTVENVEEQQQQEQQPDENNGGVPPPLRIHKEMLSKNYIQFALKVLGCEYEVIDEPMSETSKQFYEEAMSDPFFAYACEDLPHHTEIPPAMGYYDNNMEQELAEFDRDVERCKELPNFGFPMSFDSDVSVHFQSPPEKSDHELSNGDLEPSSSADQTKKGE